MTEAQTYAWIFYATSAAAGNQPAKQRDIEAVADGINHAVPTQKEMATSLEWAESKGLLQRKGKMIQLTDTGRTFAAQFTERAGSVMKTWDRITAAFKRMGADNTTNLDCRTMKPEQGANGNPH
jgi:hypothetical protein